MEEEPEKEKPEEEEEEEEEGSNYAEIPGSYGSRCFGALRDRLDFFWFQGEARFWASRMEKYGSTVFRVNVPPSPPGFPATRAIMLLDQKTYPILFDTAKANVSSLSLSLSLPESGARVVHRGMSIFVWVFGSVVCRMSGADSIRVDRDHPAFRVVVYVSHGS